MKKLILATRNDKKKKELKNLLKDVKARILSLNDLKRYIPAIVEDGKTFRQNAIKKAESSGIKINNPKLSKLEYATSSLLSTSPKRYSLAQYGRKGPTSSKTMAITPIFCPIDHVDGFSNSNKTITILPEYIGIDNYKYVGMNL